MADLAFGHHKTSRAYCKVTATLELHGSESMPYGLLFT